MSTRNPIAGVAGALLVPAAGFSLAASTFDGGVWPLVAGLTLLVVGIVLEASLVFGEPAA